ncbi:MAG: GHMP kinase [Candidatus Bathyarchaeota archaeon]|nr:MAG: GHMP kinase [Candidatus Bathyarchaeota archaeon]
MREASAFAPGHITGFFQICDQAEDPLRKGSRGCGASIPEGVHTRVSVEPFEESSYIIRIDGRTTNEAIVSENVLDKMLGRAGQPYRVVVEHELGIPLGAGFGSSGVGALTLALALNDALELGLSPVEASWVAHVAEIECRTGLGTVFAAMEGGFGVLYEPGAPGIGRAIKYDRSEDLSVVYVHFGPIATSEALSKKDLRRRINELGGRFVDEIMNDLNPRSFMELSRWFTEHVGIMTPRLRHILGEMDEAGAPCTMAMFGEALFSLVTREEANGVAEALRDAAPGHRVRVTPVEDVGARLI